MFPDERVWYDQFTSTDWVHDSIADAYRVKALRSRTDIRGRIKAFFDGAQGWILSALVGFITATVAYTVDVSEAPVFDWKDGYCSKGFFLSEKVCDHVLNFLETLGSQMLSIIAERPLNPCAFLFTRKVLFSNDAQMKPYPLKALDIYSLFISHFLTQNHCKYAYELTR